MEITVLREQKRKIKLSSIVSYKDFLCILEGISGVRRLGERNVKAKLKRRSHTLICQFCSIV